MRTLEIPRNEWKPFFDSFSRRHEGWLVRLEVFGPDVGAQTEGHELKLEGVAAELRGCEDNGIEIMVGREPDQHITHSVTRPAAVSLEQTDAGADEALAIKSEDGVTTLLRFRSAMLPEMVDGLVA